MAQFTLPYFGSIDSNALESNYDTEVRLAGQDIRLNLNFPAKSMELSSLSILNKYLGNLEEHLAKTKEYIRDNYHDEDAADGVRFYFEFHKDEFGEEVFNNQLGINNVDDPDEQLLSKLNPVRIGLYPGHLDFAIFDYTVGEELTNYMAVVKTDEDGDLANVSVES
ncbi:DUF2004 domain-containing protein [Chitinophaga sp.]|uniref:DUF2004 domain-containing protein n=1 Tax=Chitinophaga sp. TaxID=1869181 RepID=UPI0031E28547